MIYIWTKENLMAYIYRISNTINSKNYIGVSIDYVQRWKQHIRALNKNRHCNHKLQIDWNKYGIDAFKFEIIEECSYAECFDKEIKYIALFNSYYNGYNLTLGGDKGGSEVTCKPVYVYDLNGNYLFSFCSRAEAERALQCYSIKECCLGSCLRGFSKTNQEWYQYSYAYCEKIKPYSKHNGNSKIIYQLDKKGNIINTFNSIADANAYCKLTRNAHNLRDASRTHKSFHNSYWCYAEDYTKDWEPYNENTVVCFDLDGNLVGYYRNATHASSLLNIDNSSISKNLKGKRKTCGGKIFRFIK